jgi:hypothetical protein
MLCIKMVDPTRQRSTRLTHDAQRPNDLSTLSQLACKEEEWLLIYMLAIVKSYSPFLIV